jgi:hypothetical protein
MLTTRRKWEGICTAGEGGSVLVHNVDNRWGILFQGKRTLSSTVPNSKPYFEK